MARYPKYDVFGAPHAIVRSSAPTGIAHDFCPPMFLISPYSGRSFSHRSCLISILDPTLRAGQRLHNDSIWFDSTRSNSGSRRRCALSRRDRLGCLHAWKSARRSRGHRNQRAPESSILPLPVGVVAVVFVNAVSPSPVREIWPLGVLVKPGSGLQLLLVHVEDELVLRLANSNAFQGMANSLFPIPMKPPKERTA